MAIRRSKIASVADSAEPTKVQPSDLDLESIPLTPQDGDERNERTGTSPNRFIRKYVYDNGAWRLLAETQY